MYKFMASLSPFWAGSQQTKSSCLRELEPVRGIGIPFDDGVSAVDGPPAGEVVRRGVGKIIGNEFWKRQVRGDPGLRAHHLPHSEKVCVVKSQSRVERIPGDLVGGVERDVVIGFDRADIAVGGSVVNA